ncbi:MAG: SGNH/GDSL hydrolase family protein [Verrucomicrobiales bacterium]|nr:SGNH/GDSL hydrolase family protein [Verrucomicrobiales bacterium]
MNIPLKVKALLIVLTGIAFSGSRTAAADAPIWDLATSAIPEELQSGDIKKTGNGVILTDGAAFAVPASAFPDQKNFTVQVTFELSELIDHSLFTVMSKQSGGDTDDGFTVDMNYRETPYYARRLGTYVNNIFMKASGIGGQRGPETNKPYTITVAVRDGYASFYLDDRPFKQCFMEMIPNDQPMWIGRHLKPADHHMSTVINSVKVFGPEYKYISPKESQSDNPRGAVAGKGWALDVPKIEHPEWPKVLIYGDSISMGYRGSFIPEMLKQQVYVFHCVHFVGGEVPKAALTEMAGRYQFDAIVFNNGLHSLHWTPAAVPDQRVHDRMSDLAKCFKDGAPQAEIFYLMTTPHTAPRPAKDQPVSELGEKNDVVVRLNHISQQVMEAEGIEVIDVYSPLAEKLELASGDGYHWRSPAYQFITREISEKVLPTLKKE